MKIIQSKNVLAVKRNLIENVDPKNVGPKKRVV